MQEILVDIGEHAGGCLEGMVSSLEACIFMSVLMGSVAGEDSCNIEDYGSFFVGKRVLGGRLVCKGIEPGLKNVPLQSIFHVSFYTGYLPGKGDLYVVLVDREPQV